MPWHVHHSTAITFLVSKYSTQNTALFPIDIPSKNASEHTQTLSQSRTSACQTNNSLVPQWRGRCLICLFVELSQIHLSEDLTQFMIVSGPSVENDRTLIPRIWNQLQGSHWFLDSLNAHLYDILMYGRTNLFLWFHSHSYWRKKQNPISWGHSFPCSF